MLRSIALTACIGVAAAGTVLWDGWFNVLNSNTDIVNGRELVRLSLINIILWVKDPQTPYIVLMRVAWIIRSHGICQFLAFIQKPNRLRQQQGCQDHPRQHLLLEWSSHTSG